MIWEVCGLVVKRQTQIFVVLGLKTHYCISSYLLKRKPCIDIVHSVNKCLLMLVTLPHAKHVLIMRN